MTMLIKTLAAVAAGTMLATSAFAQSATEVRNPSTLVPIANEPAPRLFVDAPLPEALARGAAVIPYRVENFRILPVLGAAAVNVSPRVGHLHVTVDDLPWYWGDFSNSNTVVVTGLPLGQHKVKIQLSDPTHRILATETVTFTVSGTVPHPH
jgi:Family of unknown function (DUF6130)